MRRGLALVVWLAAGCVRAGTVTCADGAVCPEGDVCRIVGDEQRCVDPADVAACELDACPADHACHDGVCLPIECGNKLIDPGETCDDGTNVTGSGCSPACQREVCGNGTVDPTRLVGMTQVPNEQCDDGNTAGHDGCNASCVRESLGWRSFSFTSPVHRADASLAYDSARQRFVMFGGATGGFGSTPSLFADTWESETGDGWVQIGTPVSPSPRDQAGLAYDPLHGRTLLFGGESGAPLGDTWLWDGELWTPVQPANPPPPRAAPALAYDPTRHGVVMVGGSALDTTLGDTWLWDGQDWTKLSIHDNPVAPAALAFDPVHAQLVLVGMIGTGAMATFTLGTGGWTEVPAAMTPQLGGRPAIAFDGAGQRVVLYATNATGAVVGTYALVNGVWVDTQLSEPSPGRGNVALAADPAHGRVVMFGGSDSIGIIPTFYDETWQWSAAGWTKLKVTPALVKRAARAAAFDPLRRAYVTFGGVDEGGAPTQDTWELQGTRWTSLGAVGPQPRAAAAMAYDAARAEMVMFGGTKDAVAPDGLDDTWIYKQGEWSQPALAARPPGRYGHAMAYDPGRRVVVMFGGQQRVQGPLGDTWEWDGTTWVRKATNGPAARVGATLVFDEALGKVVLFGGSNGQDLDDAWTWDGTTWARLTTSGFGPSARTDHGAVWDAQRGRMVVAFGVVGTGGTAVAIPDVWDLVGSTWEPVFAQSQPPPRASGVMLPALDGSGIVLFDGDTQPDLTRAQGRFDDFWRLRFDGPGVYEACSGDGDLDGDGARGCADPDCAALCDPLCPPGATCAADRPRCGDGTCDADRESCRNCPADCGCTPVCGDFACDAGESHAGCPGDCP